MTIPPPSGERRIGVQTPATPFPSEFFLTTPEVRHWKHQEFIYGGQVKHDVWVPDYQEEIKHPRTNLQRVVEGSREISYTVRQTPPGFHIDVSTYAERPHLVNDFIDLPFIIYNLGRMGVSRTDVSRIAQLKTAWLQAGGYADIFLTGCKGPGWEKFFVTCIDHAPSELSNDAYRDLPRDYQALAHWDGHLRQFGEGARALMSVPQPLAFCDGAKGYDYYATEHIPAEKAEELKIEMVGVMPNAQMVYGVPMVQYSAPLSAEGKKIQKNQEFIGRMLEPTYNRLSKAERKPDGVRRADWYKFVRQQQFDIVKGIAMLQMAGGGTLPYDLQPNAGDIMGKIAAADGMSNKADVNNLHIICAKGGLIDIGGKKQFMRYIQNYAQVVDLAFPYQGMVQIEKVVARPFEILSQEEIDKAWEIAWKRIPKELQGDLQGQLRQAIVHSQQPAQETLINHRINAEAVIQYPSLFRK